MYIIWIGYLFVVLMLSAAQPSLLRAAVYLLLLAVLPTLFVAWVLRVRRRNRLVDRGDDETTITKDESI